MAKTHAGALALHSRDKNDHPQAIPDVPRLLSVRESNSPLLCPLCGSAAAHHFSLPHTSVWKCSARECKLHFADPQLDDRKLAEAYKNLYYPSENGSRPVHFENTSEDVLRQVLCLLEQRIGTLRGFRLLDYGCGTGSLLRTSRQFGMQPIGIEYDARARATAAEMADVPVYQDLDDLAGHAPASQFNLITLWTVIEHLRRPWADLARLRTLLAPGGWLLVSTINIGCLRARIERQRWSQYRNPTHFYYFDSNSLARVIQRAGFAQLSPLPLRFDYPHHSPLRRSLHYAGVAMGLADGIYYLCRSATPASSHPHKSRGGM